MILLTIAHILKTAELSNLIILFGTGIVNLVLQLGFNQAFNKDYEKFSLTKLVSVASTFVIWILATILDPFSFEAVSFALLLAVHAAFAEEDLTNSKLHAITAAMIQIFVFQLTNYIGLDYYIVAALQAITCIFQLTISQAKIFTKYTQYHRVVSQVVLVLSSLSITYMLVDRNFNTLEQNVLTATLVGIYILYTVFTALAPLIASAPFKSEQTITTVFLALSSLIVITTGHIWLAISLLVVMAIQGIVLAKKHMTPSFVNLYIFCSVVAVGLLGSKIDVPESLIAFLVIIPSVSVFMYGLVQRGLDLKSRENLQCYAMTTGTIVSFILFSWGFSDLRFNPLDVSTLLVGYISYVMIWKYLELYPDRRSHYVKLFFGLLLYYWHIFILQQFISDSQTLRNIQVFTAPLALAFIWSAHKERKQRSDDDTETALDLFGSLTLFGPTALQALGSNTFYSFLGIIYGMVFILLGNSTDSRRYQQIGAGAIVLFILAETGSFLFTLPRWLVIGLLGFGLIGAAIFLLTKRKESDIK